MFHQPCQLERKQIVHIVGVLQSMLSMGQVTISRYSRYLTTNVNEISVMKVDDVIRFSAVALALPELPQAHGTRYRISSGRLIARAFIRD